MSGQGEMAEEPTSTYEEACEVLRRLIHAVDRAFDQINEFGQVVAPETLVAVDVQLEAAKKFLGP